MATPPRASSVLVPFTDEETKAPGGEAACPNSELRTEPRYSDSQAVTCPLPWSHPKVKPVWPRWCHHTHTYTPKVPAREAAPALGHTNRGEFQQLSSPAGAVGVGVRRAAWREKQGWQTCSLQRGWFRLPRSSLWMTPLTPAPPRALSQGSLLSPRPKEQGLPRTLHSQRGHDGERDLWAHPRLGHLPCIYHPPFPGHRLSQLWRKSVSQPGLQGAWGLGRKTR